MRRLKVRQGVAAFCPSLKTRSSNAFKLGQTGTHSADLKDVHVGSNSTLFQESPMNFRFISFFSLSLLAASVTLSAHADDLGEYFGNTKIQTFRRASPGDNAFPRRLESAFKPTADRYCRTKGYSNAISFYYEFSPFDKQYLITDVVCAHGKQMPTVIGLARATIAKHRLERGDRIPADMARLLETTHVGENVFKITRYADSNQLVDMTRKITLRPKAPAATR